MGVRVANDGLWRARESSFVGVSGAVVTGVARGHGPGCCPRISGSLARDD